MHHLFHSLFFLNLSTSRGGQLRTPRHCSQNRISQPGEIFWEIGKHCNAAMFSAIHNLENNYFVYDQPLPRGVVGHPTRHIDHVIDRLQTVQGYFLLLDLQCLNLIG